MKTNDILNTTAKKAAILVCLIVAFMAVCLTGCQTGETAQKGEPVTLEATATQAELQEKLSDESVSGVVLSGNISLTEPLQIAGSKSITGTGTISAADDFSGDYLIAVSAKGELLLGGDVVVDAAGAAGGVHVASNAVLTLQDQTAVKNASAERANLLVEGFLDMLSGSVSNAQGHNIHNVGQTNIVGGEIRGSGSGFAGIYNEGTLTQNGGTVAGGYNNIVSAEGSEFTWNGGSNESAVNNGLIVAPKAKLTVTAREAKLTEAGNLGIELQGTAVIDDITLNNSFSTLIRIAPTGKLTLNGGVIFGASLHGVDNAGVMIMNGGDIMSCADCGIVNTGTLEIKAGGISDNGNKGILNKLEGKATVIGEDIMLSGNRFAIGNEDKAYFELAKAYIMSSTTSNIYALDGEMYIHDIELGASNSNNIRVVAADLKLKDVAVNGNATSGSQSMHGIILEGGSVHATDLIVRNTTGAGIRNKGGSFTGKNVTLENNKYIGIYTSNQDVTGRAGTTVLENLTVSKQGYMSISSNGDGVLEITNGVFEATPSNNIRVNGGTVKLNKVEVKGHTEAATKSHHGVYLEGGHIIANNLTITDTKGHGLRNKGGNFTGTNVVIKNVGGDAGVSNVMLANGASGVITLTNVAFSNVKSKNVVCEAGVIRINNSTLSASPGSNIKITGGTVALNDVNVMGNQKVGDDALHAIIIENGKGTLTAKNTTISGAKNSGIRNKTGVVEATNLTIKDCGSSAISNGEDAALGLKGITKIDGLTAKDCGNNNIVVDAGEVHITDAKLEATPSNNVKTSGTGLLTLSDAVVNGSTGSYGVIAEGGTIKLTDVTIKDTKTAGIRVNKATGSVTGTNVTIQNTGTHAIYVNHGSVEIKGLTTKDIDQRNIEVGSNAEVEDGKKIAATGGTVKIVDGKLCKTENQHSVVSYGENAGTLVELTNVTLNGSGKNGGSRHVILAEGGNVKLTDVTIKDANNAALRVNKSASTVEAENLTIQGGNWGISASAGKVTVKNLKSTAENRNIAGEGATIVVEGAELGKTETHNIKISKGSLTLKNATIAGSSDRGIMIEPGKSDGQPKVDLTNVKIADTKSSAIENRGGIVTAKDLTITGSKAAAIQTYVHKDGKTAGSVTVENYTVSDSHRSINSESGTVTVKGGTFGVTPGHNVKTTSGKVSLTDVTIEGTKADSGVMAEGGDVELTNVTIKNAKVAAIRVNKAASSVTGSKVKIDGTGECGIYVNNGGSVEISDLTTANIGGRNIEVGNNAYTEDGKEYKATGGTVKINGGTLCKTEKQHSVVSYGENQGTLVELTNVTLNGSGKGGGSRHVILAEGGNVKLTDVTIKDANNAAIRINKAASTVEGTNVTIEGAAYGISGSKGKVSIKNLTSTASVSNILAEGATITVNGGTLNATGEKKDSTPHNVKTTSGSVALTNVVINGVTDSSAHVLMGEGGDMVLTNVTVKGAKNSALRVNRAATEVTATNLTIQDSPLGVSVSAGTVTINGLAGSAANRNMEITGGTVTVNGGTLAATATHNIKIYDGKLSLKDVTVEGSSDRGIMVEPEENEQKPVVDLVNVKISNTVSYALDNKGGTVTASNLTTENCARSVNNDAGTVTVNGGTFGVTPGHNVKAASGTVKLTGVTINGTTKDNGLMVEGGDFVLSDVTIKNSKNAAIRINKSASSVEGSNVTMEGGAYGISGSAGTVTINGLTTKGTGRSMEITGGTYTVNGGTFGSTPGHNVKATSGTVKLTGVTINGTTEGNGIMAEGGDFELTNVTVQGAAGNAIRANKAESTVTVSGLTVQNCAGSVSVDLAAVTVDTMTADTTGINAYMGSGTLTIKNATQTNNGSANVVEHVGGTLNLENVTAATIYNKAADLNISGKIVGSITNDKAVAVNVTGALATDSAIVIDWTEGNAPTGTAISFAEGTMEAGKSCFTLGAVQSQIKKLVFENNTGRLENLYNYVAQVGETKYEDLNEAITALNQLTGDQTLIILADCGDESTTIEIPDGMNLTIQGGDYIARLGATVKVGANDTLSIGKNVTFGNVEVIVEGVPYEEVLTLAEGHSVTADMFSLKTEAGVAYGAMIENNKVMVYTKEAADANTLQAVINNAPDNKRGYIIVTGDVTLSDTLIFPANKILTVMDDGEAVRTISRTNAAVDMINIETGADITIKSSGSTVTLILDGKNVGNNGKAMVGVVGGTANIQNVNIVNGNKNYNLFCSGGVLNVTSAELGENYEVSSVYVTGGKVSLSGVTVGAAGSNSIRAKGGEIALHNVTINGHSASGNFHNIYIDGGTVTATGTLALNNSNRCGIRIASGSFDGAEATKIEITKPGTHGVWSSGGTVTLNNATMKDSGSNMIVADTNGTVNLNGTTTITGSGDASDEHGIYIYGGTVKSTGTLSVTANKGCALRISDKGGSLSGDTVTLNAPANVAVYMQAGSVNAKIANVTAATDQYAVRMQGGSFTVTEDGSIQGYRNFQIENDAKADTAVDLTGVTLKTSTHRQIKAGQGTIKLTDVTIEGSGEYGILLENKFTRLELTNVEIKNTKRAAIRMTINATVIGSNVTFTNIGNSDSTNLGAISATNGTVNIDGVTATGGKLNVEASGTANVTLNNATMSSSGVNVSVAGGTATIKNSTLTTTGTSNVVEHTGGTLNLENVTAATVYNTAANLNISGKTVGSITNDAAVAVNVTGALTDGSAVTIDWTEGNAPADTAISFADGTMDASAGYFTLGATQNQINNLVFADNVGKLVSKVFVAQVGEKKYEIFADAVAAITAENNTLTLLESSSATGAIVVPEGVNLTIQGGDKVANLNATVQVGEGETLTIGNNVKIAKVDATSGGSIVYAGNTASAESPLTVVVEGVPHEVALTLAEGSTATANMFSLVDAAGNAYGSLIEDGKVKVYTKDVNTQEAMQAAIDAAPDNARGYIVVTGDVTINSTVNFTANKILTMQDDGTARKILRGETTDKMLQVEAGANVTIKSSASTELLVIDGESANGKTGSGMVNTSGTLTLQNVALQNNTWNGNNRGLGVYANTGSTVYINNTRIENIHNTYVDDEGDGVKAPALIVNGSTVHMNGATIKNCTTKGNGAVEIINGGKLYANASAFASNQAAYGGAIIIGNEANNALHLDGCSFTGNTATGNAGAIQIDYKKTADAITIKNCTFTNNTATSEGGAISAATGATITLESCQFSGNKANRAATNVAQNYGNDIRLGGASNVVKISGKMQVEIFNHNAATLYVVGNLTAGSNVVIDGRTDQYMPNPAISFASGIMATSQNYISLGASQTAANKYLQFVDDKAVLVDIPVVTTQAELEQALANAANIPVIKIAANTTVSLENVAFPTTAVTIQGQTGSVLKYGGSSQKNLMMSFPEGSNVTFQGVTLDGNAVGKLLIPAGANVTLANSTVTNMKGVSDRSVDVCGNLNLRGTVTIDGANWGLGVQGSGKVTSEAGSKLIIKNSTYGVTTHGTANVHIVEIETTNVSNSGLYNDNSAVMVVDKANLGAPAAGKYTTQLRNGTVTLSNAIVNGNSQTPLQFTGATVNLNNVSTVNVTGCSHSLKMNGGTLNVNGMNMGVSKSNNFYIAKGVANLSGICTISGNTSNNGMRIDAAGTVNVLSDCTLTISHVANKGIIVFGGYLNLAGTVNTTIGFDDCGTNNRTLNVTAALGAGSAVNVDWIGDEDHPTSNAITFASAEVLNASKDMITLGGDRGAAYELTFGETAAILTAIE